MRFFTTEGPVNCADHYCLPPLTRFDLDDVLALIAQKKYFLLHAPRQTGKTTYLLALAEYLNREGRYRTVYANIETAQAAREDVAMGMGEYGLGRRRTDLLIVWPYPGGVQRAVIELKLLYGSLAQTLATGMQQTWAYADACAAEEAHLVIFDRTPGKPWSERIWRRDEVEKGMAITVWGM